MEIQTFGVSRVIVGERGARSVDLELPIIHHLLFDFIPIQVNMNFIQ